MGCAPSRPEHPSEWTARQVRNFLLEKRIVLGVNNLNGKVRGCVACFFWGANHSAAAAQTRAPAGVASESIRVFGAHAKKMQAFMALDRDGLLDVAGSANSMWLWTVINDLRTLHGMEELEVRCLREGGGRGGEGALGSPCCPLCSPAAPGCCWLSNGGVCDRMYPH